MRLLSAVLLFGSVGPAMAQNCSICGDGSNVTDPAGVVQIPNQSNLTCAELESAATAGSINATQCSLLASFTQGPCGCTKASFVCDICGNGGNITIPDGIVQIPTQPNRTCAKLYDAAIGGNISQVQCSLLPPFTSTPCGCRATVSIPSDAPSMLPTLGSNTSVPVESPTFGPAPECFTNLTEVFEREKEVTNSTIPRMYVLCPNTKFVIGRISPSDGSFVGGDVPISPRANVHYKCGQDGSSSNNCVLVDGSWQLISFFTQFPEPNTNVTIEGITFEAAFGGGLLHANPGTITYIDCIFRVRSKVVLVTDAGCMNF